MRRTLRERTEATIDEIWDELFEDPWDEVSLSRPLLPTAPEEVARQVTELWSELDLVRSALCPLVTAARGKRGKKRLRAGAFKRLSKERDEAHRVADRLDHRNRKLLALLEEVVSVGSHLEEPSGSGDFGGSGLLKEYRALAFRIQRDLFPVMREP